MPTKPKSKLRRLSDSLASGSLLTPHLERDLVTRGENLWPDEYAIKIVNKERHWDGYFHPSSHAALPEMELYYMFHPDYRVHRDTLSPETIMTFQVGSAYHALVQSMLIHLGYTTEEEVEVSFVNEEKHVSGTLDIREITLPDGRKMPVEIKSAGFVPKEPPIYYQQQFQIYMDAAFDEPREEGLFLFLEKVAPHRFKEFYVKRDEAMVNAIYRKWNRVLEAIEFNSPNMLEYPCHEFDSKQHRECPARFVCRLGLPTGERFPVR